MSNSPLSRRDFLATTAATAAGLALSSAAIAARLRDEPPVKKSGDDKPAPDKSASTPPKKLKILILGGTHITGPHLVRMALARGHTVTVFNRGKTEKRIGALPDEVEKLLGDRDPKVGTGLKALEGERTWDAVIDTSGQFPRHVRASCELLAKRCSHYTYISSISAYKSPIAKNANEDAPLATLEDPTVEDMGEGFRNYGGLKAACEKVVQEIYPASFCIIRPTFISGPGDDTDRFSYFPVRVSRGGEMLAPGNPNDPMQFIDSRDLAAWMLHIAESAATKQPVVGIFNAAGPFPPTTIGELLAVSKQVCSDIGIDNDDGIHFTWVPASFIEHPDAPAQSPKRGMSIWIPPEGEEGGMSTVRIDRAMARGLKLRPIRETVKDTLEWWPKEVARRERVGKELTEQAKKDGKDAPKLAPPDELRAGPTADEEKALLAAWHAKEKKAG